MSHVMAAMSNNAVIQTKSLSKTYRDFWGRERVLALQPLNIEIMSGEIFGLLGPNGSGKTTTIKLLLGLLYPSSGDAFVFDRDPGNQDAKRRIGYLPEETYLYKFLDAEETLKFYGSLFGIAKDVLHKRIDELLKLVGLEHARKRRLGEYSKGMARRLGLAQALINDPDLVILDEPTAGLDPIGTAEVKELIVELKNKGKTVLLCSHLLADVEDVCDRLAILHNGVLKACGRVDELLCSTERTVIEMNTPDAACLDAVKAAAGDRAVTVNHPRERLETYFRRIVASDVVAESAPESTVESAAEPLSESTQSADAEAEVEVDEALVEPSNKTNSATEGDAP
ncbi:MAG: ATP-binding cassette domain-containing protein [Planctomycetes bacterium]|nr:ATP-binding cassette domain-containing protein [Planctomycetota bacterium]